MNRSIGQQQRITEADFTVIGCAGGGTNAKHVIGRNGMRYVYKKGKNPAHIMSEILAYKLYAAAGAPVPAIQEVYSAAAGNQSRIIGMLVDFIEGDSLLGMGKKIPSEVMQQIEATFVWHALFANWDAKGRDNYIYNPTEGKVYIIDLGGALQFRAKGDRKAVNDFGATVKELNSLPERADRFFGRLRDAVIRAQVTCQQQLPAQEILAAVTGNPQLFETAEQQRAFATIIAARLQFLDSYCRTMAQQTTA